MIRLNHDLGVDEVYCAVNVILFYLIHYHIWSLSNITFYMIIPIIKDDNVTTYAERIQCADHDNLHVFW